MLHVLEYEIATYDFHIYIYIYRRQEGYASTGIAETRTIY